MSFGDLERICRDRVDSSRSQNGVVVNRRR